MAGPSNKHRSAGFGGQIDQTHARVGTERGAGHSTTGGLPSQSSAHRGKGAEMVLVVAAFAYHRSGEKQFKQRFMINGRNVGERGVDHIKHVPIDVGRLFSQPTLTHGGGLVAAPGSCERAGLEEFRDVTIEGASGDLARQAGQFRRTVGTIVKDEANNASSPKRARSSFATRLGLLHGRRLGGHQE